jgi:hypothetical protein
VVSLSGLSAVELVELVELYEIRQGRESLGALLSLAFCPFLLLYNFLFCRLVQFGATCRYLSLFGTIWHYQFGNTLMLS